MAFDWKTDHRLCMECAKSNVKLRKFSKKFTLLPAWAPLEYAAVDKLGELIRTKHGYKNLLVTTDRFSNLTRTIPLNQITANAVASAVVTHLVFVYGPPVHLHSDNGSQFT